MVKCSDFLFICICTGEKSRSGHFNFFKPYIQSIKLLLKFKSGSSPHTYFTKEIFKSIIMKLD